MNVVKHISNDIKPPSTDDIVADVLELMEEMKISHLPVVDEEHIYLGVISEENLLEVMDDNSQLNSCLRCLQPYSVPVETNVLEVVHVASEGSLSLVPIVDKDNRYRGYISVVELLQDMGNQLSFKEEGGVLVLKIPSMDYQLSQISQIVESEDARILGVWINSNKDLNSIDVALKINQKDLGRIIKSFERYSYTIKEVFHDSLFDDTAQQRYESLMKYLNI